MPVRRPTSVDSLDDEKEALRNSLDRIADALEKQNEQIADKANGKRQEGGESKKKEGDKGSSEADQKKDEPGKVKRFFRSPLGIAISLAILALLIVGIIAIWRYESAHESTDDAYTAGHVHQVSPRISGLALEVWVDDNQAVKKGDLLVKLDPRDYEVALQRAQASLEQAKAQALQSETAIVQARADYEQAKAKVEAARAQTTEAAARYDVAQINYARNKGLFTKDVRAVAQQDVDTTKSNLDASRGELDAAKANVQSAEASAESAKTMISTREAALVVAQAAVAASKASVADADLQLSYCWVVAPAPGRVSKKTVETGQQLTAGQPVMAVTEDDVWVLANFKETQLARIRVGQRVKLPVDTFKSHPFSGRVDSIQNGSGATYSLLPPDNATGNFTKIVQRVPVKITFDRDSLKGYESLVVPGLSVVPVVDLAGPPDDLPQASKADIQKTGGLPQQ